MRIILKNAFFYAMEWLGVNKYFRYRYRGLVKTLMFHSISPPGQFFKNAISASIFTRQLHHLSKKYSILNMSQDGHLSGYDPMKVNILLTFDDGFIDNYTVAAPILAEFKMSAVFFVIADCLLKGSPPKFIVGNMVEDSMPNIYRTINKTQTQELLAMGMTVGSHGNNHFDYTSISADAGLDDARESQKKIEAEIGVPIESFAFPWVDIGNSRLIRLVACIGGYLQPSMDLTRLTIRYFIETKWRAIQIFAALPQVLWISSLLY